MSRKDLKDIKMNEKKWYEEATRSRAGWRAAFKQEMGRQVEAQNAQSLAAAREIKCEVCSRKFRRENNRKRHKYLKERSLPVSKQKGAAQCQLCNRWFRSRGGLAVHTYRPSGS